MSRPSSFSIIQATITSEGGFSHDHKRLVIWVLFLCLLCAISLYTLSKFWHTGPLFLSHCSHTGFGVFALLALIKTRIPLICFIFLIYSIGVVRAVHVGMPIAQK